MGVAGPVRGGALGSPSQTRPKGKERELCQKPVPDLEERAVRRGRLTRQGMRCVWLRDTASIQQCHREETRARKP